MSTESSTAGRLVRKRLRFERDFTQIPNTWLRDKRLRRGSKGLLVELFSHDHGYTVTIKQLARESADGITATRTQVEELEAMGYLRRTQRRATNGRLTHTDWELIDPTDPVDNPALPIFEQPAPDEAYMPESAPDAYNRPSSGFPTSEEPTAENPTSGNPTTKEDQLKNTHTHLPEVTTEGPSARSQVACKAPGHYGRHRFDLTSGWCPCGVRSDDTQGA